MAKKIVRGITDIKDINNQDFDTNNVNDLLSDGQYNYIHRKKGKAEEYHNLTDNIKTISSDNTELLSVTNNNKTTNTATLHPKHDAQKEQLLESTDETILISHGENGTEETTSVDVNPAKVLTHDNLESTNGTILISHGENGTEETTSVDVNPAKIFEMVGITYHDYTAEDFKGTMQTYKQPVDADNDIFHLTVRLNKNEERATFNLDQEDEITLEYLFSLHGINGQFNVNNGIFSFSENLHTIEYYNNTGAVSYNSFITGFTFIVPKDPTIDPE